MADITIEQALLEKPCYTRLSQYGIIEVQGQDAKTFLQGQLTLDLRKVTTSQTGFGGYCNLKGRLHAIFTLMMRDETTYWLIMPSSIIPHTLDTLKKYAMFSKVTCHDISERLKVLGITQSVLSHLALDSEIRVCSALKNRCFVVGSLDVIEKCLSTLTDKATPITEELWMWLDIQAGIPQLDANTIETFLPHHLNFKAFDGLSFDKGCYLGQEIIARMEYLGQIKKHLYQATIKTNDLPAPGTVVFRQDKTAVGELVFASKGPIDIAALIVLQDEDIATDLELEGSHLHNILRAS